MTNQETPSNEAKPRTHNRNAQWYAWRALAVELIARGAFSLASDKGLRPSLESRRLPVTQPTPASVGPKGSFPTTDQLDCQTSERTIHTGDTIFGLTTVGLNNTDYPDFANIVYAGNLRYISQQAKTDKVLANPNNIPVGHKLQILDNCIEVEQVYQGYYEGPTDSAGNSVNVPEYDRWVSYQNYIGTDKKVHHGVGINYKTDQNGHFLSVDNCQPRPVCDSYVVGAPPSETPGGGE